MFSGHNWPHQDWLYFRDPDEIDDQILAITKEVSKFAFPEHEVPTADTILTGFKDIVTDSIFTGPGAVTTRKIAEKVKLLN